MQWISENSDSLQVLSAAVTALIWIAYLQLFLSSYRRQRRPMIMIEIGGGIGMRSLAYVGNLGFEPLYVSNVFVKATTSDGSAHEAVVTDRDELSEKELNNPLEATNQGPLNSGESFCIGSFGTLLGRVKRQSGERFVEEDIQEIRIILVAVTAGSGNAFVAARRTYLCAWENGDCRLTSTTLVATQVRSFWQRWRLKRLLQKRLLSATPAEWRQKMIARHGHADIDVP